MSHLWLKSVIFFCGLAVGVLGTAVLRARPPESPHEPAKLFLYDRETLKGPMPSLQMFNRTSEIREICPDVALVMEENKSDYSQSMFWIQDHWRAVLSRKDGVLLVEESPDFDKIMRKTCNAIRQQKQQMPRW